MDAKRLSILLVFVASVLAAHAQYIAYDLGQGSAQQINSSRTIVGATDIGSSQFACQFSGGVCTILSTFPGMDYSTAYGINDLGNICGTYGNNSTGAQFGYLYRAGVVTPLSALGSTTACAAINNAGTIVGYSALPNYLSHAFCYSQGTTTDLGTLGGRFSYASSINSAGVIVGAADLSLTTTHAFRYENGVMTDLGSLDGRMSHAEDINDLGVIVGYSTAGGPSSGYEHAFRYNAGAMTDLGTLSGPLGSSEASAINSLGVIVGTSDAWGGTAWTRHAFVYRDGVMTDLAPYLASIGLVGQSFGSDINDNGDIVGVAVDANGDHHGFALFVVPEPSTAALLAFAVVLCPLRRWHKSGHN